MPEHKKTAGQRFYIFCENISNKTQRVRNKNTLTLAMCLRTFTDNYRSPRLSFDPTLGAAFSMRGQLYIGHVNAIALLLFSGRVSVTCA